MPRKLFLPAFIIFALFLHNPAAAQDTDHDLEDMRQSIGALTTQGLLVTHSAVNTLMRSYQSEDKGGWEQKDVQELLTLYQNVLGTTGGFLNRLQENDHLSAADQKFIATAMEGYNALGHQISSAKNLINTGEERFAEAFKTYSSRTWDILTKLMKLD
jgi:hypothetical protein